MHFYAEVRRVLKPKGCLAVVGYGLIEAQDPQLLNYFNIWSGLKHYVKQHNQSPLAPLEAYFEAQPRGVILCCAISCAAAGRPVR